MFNKGTVVLVPFPFTNLKGVKVRPAVIISSKPIGDDVAVLFISSITKNKPRKFDIPIDTTSENGLKASSIIKCSKIATLEKKVIIGELGKIDSKNFKLIDAKLKEFLGL